MNIEQLLEDTFAAHEHLAPSEGELLRGVHDRIGSSKSGYTRPLAVVASIAIAASVTVGVVAITHRTDSASHQSSLGTNQSGAAHQTTRSHVASSGEQPETADDLTMPYDLTGLPATGVSYIVRRADEAHKNGQVPRSGNGEYMFTLSTSSHIFTIDVQQMAGAISKPHLKSGEGRPTTINGRSAFETKNPSAASGYELYFQDSSGSSMYVNVAVNGSGPIPASRLSALGRHVATGVRFPGTQIVQPTFAVRSLPAGLRVRAFDVEDTNGLPGANSASGVSTSYQIGHLSSERTAATIGTDLVGTPKGKPGRTVQGHSTIRSTNERGYTTLYLQNAANGRAVIIQSPLSISKIYRIADGLKLPS